MNEFTIEDNDISLNNDNIYFDIDLIKKLIEISNIYQGYFIVDSTYKHIDDTQKYKKLLYNLNISNKDKYKSMFVTLKFDKHNIKYFCLLIH